MNHHMELRWRGEPIGDPYTWAKSRGERVVRFHARRWVPNPLTNQLDLEEFISEAPESIYDNILTSHGWQYIELERKAERSA